MPKPQEASIKVVTTGKIHQGDTVTFAVSPPDAGVISCYGYAPGGDQVIWSMALIRGHTSVTIGASQLWNSGPLHVDVTLSELVHGKVKVIAETSFEVDG